MKCQKCRKEGMTRFHDPAIGTSMDVPHVTVICDQCNHTTRYYFPEAACLPDKDEQKEAKPMTRAERTISSNYNPVFESGGIKIAQWIRQGTSHRASLEFLHSYILGPELSTKFFEWFKEGLEEVTP